MIVLLLALAEDRFRSSRPHYLHPLLGRPLLAHALHAATAAAGEAPLYLLTDPVRRGALKNLVEAAFVPGEMPPPEGAVLIVRGELPLLRGETLRRLLDAFRAQPDGAWLLAAPEAAAPLALVAGAGHLRIPSVPTADLRRWLAPATPHRVLPADGEEGLSVNDRIALADALAVLRRRINRRWMAAGVTILDPQSTTIEVEVRLGRDTVIHPNTHLYGHTTIGEGCRIGPNTLIRDCRIGDRCRVVASVLEEAVMEEESDIGPFGHLRRGARLCRGAHMGNFGEMKNSTLGPGAKMGHFSYLGDAEVGAGVNIGAGTITCNYDGRRKHPTIIEEGAFIGSDTLLVAPVRVGAGAKTGAGSVVTRDIPPGVLAYGVPARVRRPLDEEADEEPRGEKGEGER